MASIDLYDDADGQAYMQDDPKNPGLPLYTWRFYRHCPQERRASAIARFQAFVTEHIGKRAIGLKYFVRCKLVDRRGPESWGEPFKGPTLPHVVFSEVLQHRSDDLGRINHINVSFAQDLPAETYYQGLLDRRIQQATGSLVQAVERIEIKVDQVRTDVRDMKAEALRLRREKNLGAHEIAERLHVEPGQVIDWIN